MTDSRGESLHLRMLRLLLALFLPACALWREPPAQRPALVNPALDDKLTSLLRFDVPLIGADSLAEVRDSVLLLDAREPAEYAVGHIPGAVRFPPSGPAPAWLDTVARDRRVVVYCSVGYRSENSARGLREVGFTEVANLYGSIFDWVDRGLPVVDSAGQLTDEIHTYNRRWGRLVTRDSIVKVYD